MGNYLDAIAPIGSGDGNFPYPNLVQTSTPGSASLTFEGPTINGILMPGQWIVTKLTRQFGWQEQQANFLTGAFLVPKGDPLIRVTYKIRIWESGTMGVFRQLLQTLLKKPLVSLPGGLPVAAALGIQDPMLKDFGVTNVVIDSIDYPLNPLVTSGGKGAWEGSITFIQYRPALPALPVPDQTIPDPGAVTPSAASNLATANASMTAGANTLQGSAASSFVPPR